MARKHRSLTLATIGVKGPRHAAVILKALEAGIRAGLIGPEVIALRIELMNMRWRAHLQEWGGWSDGTWDEPEDELPVMNALAQTTTWWSMNV